MLMLAQNNNKNIFMAESIRDSSEKQENGEEEEEEDKYYYSCDVLCLQDKPIS